MDDSPEWQALQRELEAVAREAKAFNAYVFDAWDKLLCSAHGFSEMPRQDLLDLIRAGIGRAGKPLQRGGTLDTCVTRPGHAYLKTYGSCYVVLVRYPGPFNEKLTRSSVADALPRIEALTLRLPPSGGPGSHPGEASKRA
jgi:hypothetical protein